MTARRSDMGLVSLAGARIAVMLAVVERLQATKRVGAMMGWFRRGLPLAVEVMMLLGSGRLAVTLLGNQGYFERFPEAYSWLVGHGTPCSLEWFWGLLAAGSALLKALGIVVCLTYRRDQMMMDLGYGMRLFGWLGAALVWGAFSASLTVWDPLAYTSIASSLALALALWGLLMGPAMPDDDIG